MLRTQEHGLFIQDDFKVGSRFTINAGLRYEIFRAETEEDNKIVNFDLANLRLIYADEDGASASVNKQTRYGNFAPRLGLTYDLFGDSSTILRTGFAITYFPEQPSASNMIGQSVPSTDLAERELCHQPDRLFHCPDHRESVPGHPAGEAAYDRRAPGGQPTRARPHVRQRDALCRTVAPGHRSPALQLDGAGTDLRRQRRQASDLLLQPERSAAGSWLAGFSPAAPANQPGQQHACSAILATARRITAAS